MASKMIIQTTNSGLQYQDTIIGEGKCATGLRYGPTGTGGSITPNATLIIEVE